MFIVLEVCKKKTINPTLFKKKGANAPFEFKIVYLVPETNPSFALRFLTFLYKVHFCDLDSNVNPSTLVFERAIFEQPSTEEYFFAFLTANILPWIA